MRKNFLIGFVMLIVSIPTFAGDYLTNTNQNAAFLRMIARGASIDVDGVYSNPAGLAFLPKDGLQVALTIQSIPENFSKEEFVRRIIPQSMSKEQWMLMYRTRHLFKWQIYRIQNI